MTILLRKPSPRMGIDSAATKAVAFCLILVVAATGGAQQGPGLSKRAESIARKIASLPAHAQISVIPATGDEEYGELLSSSHDEFTFHDVDRNTDVTFKYADVRKVRKGYGGYNHAAGRHTDRTRALIVTGCVLGALGGLIAAAASSRD